jgi:hypothetical protein
MSILRGAIPAERAGGALPGTFSKTGAVSAVIPPHMAPMTHPTSLGYTDPMFRATVEVARHFTESRRFRGLLGALARQPLTVFRVLLTVARLPIVEISINASQAAALMSRDFAPISAPIFGGRYAQAVLDLRLDDEAYLSGRHRQALRTNMRHARNMGVSVASVASYGEWATVTRAVLRSRSCGPEMTTQLRPPPATQDMAYFVAVDDRGRPTAISVVALFAEYAVLVWSLSAPDHPAASSSRYLLHTFMRSDLRGRGVRYLIAGTGVRDAPGLLYFQHLLGYEVRNLRIRVRASSEAVSRVVEDPCRLAADEVVVGSAVS